MLTTVLAYFCTLPILYVTVEFDKLGQFFIDLATAVIGEADSPTYQSNNPIYKTSAKSTEFPGK